jgi:hypothetical protein
MSTWATVVDVTTITQKTPTQEQLDGAESVIAIHCNRVPGDFTPSTRDAFYLKSAVVWQAAWMMSKPAVEARESVSQVTQDGMEVVNDGHSASVLAPLAKRSLKNLSWMAGRSVTMTRRAGGQPVSEATWLREDTDDAGQWSPL